MEPIKVERELVWFFAGLDPSGYRQAMARSDQHEDEAMLGGAAVSDEERYKDCDRLKVPCPACSKQIIVDSVFMGVVSTDEIITRDRSDNFPSLHFTSLPFPFQRILQGIVKVTNPQTWILEDWIYSMLAKRKAFKRFLIEILVVTVWFWYLAFFWVAGQQHDSTLNALQ